MFNNLKHNIRKILKEYYSVDERIAGLSLNSTDMNYDDLKDYLGGRSEKKIGHNTIIHELSNGDIGIRYHYTDIVTVDRLDNMKLKMGGWETTTTIGRLNQLLPINVRIFRKKGVTYIKGDNGTFEYRDGVKVTSHGDILN